MLSLKLLTEHLSEWMNILGEFGGQLIFEPDDKTKSTIKINRGNVKYISIIRIKHISFLDMLIWLLVQVHYMNLKEKNNTTLLLKCLLTFGDAHKHLLYTKTNFL